MTRQSIKDARRRAAYRRNKEMRDPAAHPVCYVCDFSYPPVMHLHHVHPLAETDTPSDDAVWLCPNCHAMTHEIRRVYYSERRVSNYRVRRLHLDYWLSEVCSEDAANKLRAIARENI